MIYLFCNEKYGSSFIKEIQDYKARHRHVPVTLVFSLKANVMGSGFRARMRALRNRLSVKFLQMRRTAYYRLPVILAASVNSPDFCRRIAHDDIGIIAGFNQIFKGPTIGRFKGMFNFHPSLLPFYRGPVPSYWCIKNKESFSGYTLHRVTAVIDDGEILYQDIVEIGVEKDPDALDTKIAHKACANLAGLIEYAAHGGAFTLKRLDPAQIYIHHVNYLSFPEGDGEQKAEEPSPTGTQ